MDTQYSYKYVIVMSLLSKLKVSVYSCARVQIRSQSAFVKIRAEEVSNLNKITLNKTILFAILNLNSLPPLYS